MKWHIIDSDCQKHLSGKYVLHIPDDATFIDVVMLLSSWKHPQIIIDCQNKTPQKCVMLIHLVAKHMYVFDKYTSKKSRVQIHVVCCSKSKPVVKKEIQKQNYIRIARDLTNEPANIATPEHMANVAREMFAGIPSVNVTVFDEKDLKNMGMNLILAVGQASKNKPRLVQVEYTPEKISSKTKTICLCGKGVTFDSGGLNIKIRNAQSPTMKGDKAGGCIMLSTCKYLVDTKLDCKVVCLVPFVENAVSSHSTRPGDIIQSYSGKTVEITNTDAEGRLILADVLNYSKKYSPDYIIDAATLTGWASTLHCDTSAVFFTANAHIHTLIGDIGDRVGERTWGMPRWIEYMKYCKSQVADLNNIPRVAGCNKGSGFMATMFMANFVPEKNLNTWIHFDITNNSSHTKYLGANIMNVMIELVKTLSKQSIKR